MRSTNCYKKYMAWFLVSGGLFMFALMVLTPNSSAATPSQAGVSWDYRLLGKLNSAQDPITALTMVITGSGSFDLSKTGISADAAHIRLVEGDLDRQADLVRVIGRLKVEVKEFH